MKNRLSRGEKLMNEFDTNYEASGMRPESLVEKGKRSMGASLTEAKHAIILQQKGEATIAAAKKAILALPKLPKQVKDVIEMPVYGDAILGLALGSIIPMITKSHSAIKLAIAANHVGAAQLSREFSILTDVINGVADGIAEGVAVRSE